MNEPCDRMPGVDADRFAAAGRPEAADLIDATQELSERLTALTNYIAAALRSLDLDRSPPAAGVTILEKAAAQAAAASVVVERLRGVPTRPPGWLRPHAAIEQRPPGPIYRVSFVNTLARNCMVLRACQRTVLIRSARDPERAVAAAQKRFARLEGVRDWRLRAQFIEVEIVAPAEAASSAAAG